LTIWLEHTVKITPGEFNPSVAMISTGLALLAILLSWWLYLRKPFEAGQPDPLKRMLGPVFAGMEHKWFIDEAYQFVFVDRYNGLSYFLAQTIDMDFWHDWVHNSVIAKGFVGLTRFLADPVDLGLVDKVSKVLADAVQASANSLRKIQNGFVRSYALAVMLGVVAILGYLIFK
jgi:NADH-quinone oxidoreductase subunit L